MKATVRKQRCAIYTRKSSEEGLEQEFNSLHPRRHSRIAEGATVRPRRRGLLAHAYPEGRAVVPLLRQPDGVEAWRRIMPGRRLQKRQRGVNGPRCRNAGIPGDKHAGRAERSAGRAGIQDRGDL